MAQRSEVREYLLHLEKERDVSPHTVKAYGRDLEAFTEFCNRHYGSWTWSTAVFSFIASSWMILRMCNAEESVPRIWPVP